MRSIRTLDPDAARALDAAAMDRFGIPGILLMEHAAIGLRAVVESERVRLDPARVLVICGPGGNGGDGWAVARLLAIDGVEVEVMSLASPPPGSDAAINEGIARRIAAVRGGTLSIHAGIPDSSDLDDCVRDALVVDAMYGVGLTRPISGPATSIIDVLTASESPVIAVDVPSGLDAATGNPNGPCIRAIATATMVAPKTGMLVPGASTWTGRIEVVDIGTPPSLLEEFGRMAGSAPVGDDAESSPDLAPR